MAARTGDEFLKGLRDGREVWLENERVSDVTEHPAFAGAARALAGTFDLQLEAAEVCLMPDPETGERISVSHMIPRSRADLERRHACLEKITEYSVGLMGRTPDYMNVSFAGFAGRDDEWSGFGNEEGAANLVAFQKRLARDDLSLTHTIIHPTVDKSLPDVRAAGGEVALHKVADTDRGILVRGARVLATLAPFADELAVYPAVPLPEDADAYALSFSIPMETRGLKFLCRDSFSRPANLFDYPFSSRFDEQDAFVIFDDVEIPRERLFMDGQVELYNSVMTTGWFPNICQQTMIRAQTKLEFAWALAMKMAEVVGDRRTSSYEMQGEIWSYAELTRAAVHSAEQAAYDYGNGVWFPHGGPTAALRTILPRWFPRVNEIIRLLGSHNLLAAPTRAQHDDPGLRPLVEKYFQGADGTPAEERIRVFRLAWDFVGSGLASRNEQYERFYLGSGGRNLLIAQLGAPKERAQRLLALLLEEKG